MRRLTPLRLGGPVCLAILVLAVAASSHSVLARAIVITEFPLPASGPGLSGGAAVGITSGPDGNLWFTDSLQNKIGRITPGGVVTRFSLPTPLASLRGIAAGPDGNLWFTEAAANQIGRITPSGLITEFPLPASLLRPALLTGTPLGTPTSITVGPDGALWFTAREAGRIGRITVDGAFAAFPLPWDSQPSSITLGPDGALWFLDAFGPRIGRITPGGEVSAFLLPPVGQFGLGFGSITTGSDGNLWFTSIGRIRLGRITPAGVITEFPTVIGLPGSITTGPDGNLWFLGPRSVGRITPDGVFTLFPLPASVFSYEITAGQGGALWVGASGQIVRIAATSALFDLSPPSGRYVTTQRLDPTLILAPAVTVVGGQALVGGPAVPGLLGPGLVDATAALRECLIAGTLLAGGRTFRCPDLAGRPSVPGTHAFGVLLTLADGSHLSGGVTWEIMANSEP